MKTKNNVQKTGLWLATVVVSLFLISYTVSGQDFWGKLLVNSHSNETELAMHETKKDAKTPDRDAGNEVLFLFEEATDPALEVEDWMHCDHCFGVAETLTEVENEAELRIDEWMLDETLFQGNEDYESPLEIEAWMVTKETWEI